MELALYKNKSDPRVVNKNIGSELARITGIVIKEDDSLQTLEPSLVLDIGDTWKDITDFNYVKLFQNDRYYYVKNFVAEGGLVRLDLKVDVLMSFKDDIYRKSQKTQIVGRQAMKFPDKSKYLSDEQVPITVKHLYDSKVFGRAVSDFASGRIIVETSGRGGRVI